MADCDDIKDALATNAVGPAEVSGDAGSVKQHSLKDQIEAAKFICGAAAANTARRGVRFTKLVPPGVS